MFEKASKLKLRFDTPKGNFAVEDLWDLPLTKSVSSLDNIAKALNKAVKENGEEESFVTKTIRSNTKLNLKFEIVKHIIKVKLEEIDKAQKADETKVRKEQIMALIRDKKEGLDKEKSLEDLQEILNKL